MKVEPGLRMRACWTCRPWNTQTPDAWSKRATTCPASWYPLSVAAMTPGIGQASRVPPLVLEALVVLLGLHGVAGCNRRQHSLVFQLSAVR